MIRMVVVVPPRVKMQLRRLRQATKEAGLAKRCQLILHAAKGLASRNIAKAVGCSSSWASRVIERFREEGLAGPADRREDNGVLKLDEWYWGQHSQSSGQQV